MSNVIHINKDNNYLIKSIIKSKSSIKDAMHCVAKSPIHIAFVVDNKNKFIGTVTDGDIRREIKFMSKTKDLTKFMTKKPLIINESMPASKALAIMNEKKITSLLVVSDKDYKKKNKVKLKGIIHIHFLLQYGLK